MTLEEAIADIRRGLGFRTLNTATIIAAIQSAQRTLETGASLPDFLITYDAAITVTADDPSITLPSDFLRMHDKFNLWYTDSDDGRTEIPLRTEIEGLDAYGDVTDSTHAVVWARRGDGTGVLIPTPTESDTYYLTYYAADDVLTAANLSATNLWLTHLPDVIIGTAGIEAMGAMRDKEAQTFFQQRLGRGERARMGMIVDSELAGRPIIMGRNR